MANRNTITLLDGATANGSGDWFYWGSKAPFPWRKSDVAGYFEVIGTFDGATVALEITRDGGTTVHEITTLSAVDIVAVDLPTCQVRATVSGAGASTDVTVLL